MMCFTRRDTIEKDIHFSNSCIEIKIDQKHLTNTYFMENKHQRIRSLFAKPFSPFLQ